MLLDVFSICLAFGVSLALRVFHETLPLLRYIPSTDWNPGGSARSEYAVFLVVSALGWVYSLRRSGIYLPGGDRALPRSVGAYVKAALNALLVSGAAVFTLKMFSISRIFFAYYFATCLVLLPLGQFLATKLLKRIGEASTNRRRAIVIGPEHLVEWFTGVLLEAPPGGYFPVGVVVDGAKPGRTASNGTVPASEGYLPRTLETEPGDEVFVVGGATEIAALAPVARSLIEKGHLVSLVSPGFGGEHGVAGRITQFSGIPTISFGPVPRDPVGSGIKRMIDVAGASIVLVLAAPVMLIVALLIRILDPGPIFFRQERLGMGSVRFWMYKFRSMRVNAEEALKADGKLYLKYLKNDYKLPELEDPRITPLGRFLRKTSLDELPQLLNVLKGDMSLVGPRPIVPGEIENYRPYADMLLSVRPGLTGMWQVRGRSRIRYPERAFLDLDYVGSHSVSRDISIMVDTVPSVVKDGLSPAVERGVADRRPRRDQ
jgi:exopolysaccharide biosynthesis polyprenyl glycosylphosphotransferase